MADLARSKGREQAKKQYFPRGWGPGGGADGGGVRERKRSKTPTHGLKKTTKEEEKKRFWGRALDLGKRTIPQKRTKWTHPEKKIESTKEGGRRAEKTTRNRKGTQNPTVRIERRGKKE